MKLFDRPIIAYFIITFLTLIIYSAFSVSAQVLGLEGAMADL